MKLNRYNSLISLAILFVFILTVTQLVYTDTNEKWLGIVRGHFDVAKQSGTPTYLGWQEGVRRDFNLTLQRLEFYYTLLDLMSDNDTVVLAILFEMVAFCHNDRGERQRVEMARLLFVAINKKTEQVIRVQIAEQAGPVVRRGWHGTDI